MGRDLGHIVITGASAGIGEAIARAFAGTGQRLTLVARREAPMQALATELATSGTACKVIACDLADLDRATSWVADAEAAHGPIDVLVLNAGIQIVKRALSVTDAEAEAEMRLNLLAPQRLTRLVAPTMLARGGGTIVIISSMAGLTHTPGMADYSATKAGAAAYFETLRVELEGSGVNVVTVYPGPVATDMEVAARARLSEDFLTKNLPTGAPDELGRLVRRAVAKGDARLVYPKIYGITRYMRGASQWFTYRFAPKTRE
ncbi:MAG: SDR family NAD(P)-dependent oxidoreductase [Deltaproteobacteria bacterium]|nr:SDR family NAD(P)-dependent oxidoreductase [Deltaproteobacteria bacterium]